MNDLGFVRAAAQYGLSSILVRPRRSIGDLAMQVVVEETHHDEVEMTQHPVELGAPITDHSFMRPKECVIRGGWSDSPEVAGLFGSDDVGVGSRVSGNNVAQAKDMYEQLLALQESRELIDVYTGKRFYQNMLIQQLTATTDKATEHSLFVSVTLREVIIVQTQVLTIPAPMENQSNPSATAQPVNAGAKALVESTRFKP